MSKVTQTEEALKIVHCQDCYSYSVIVNESHTGDAYCTECITLERLEETQPELYNKVIEATL